MTTAAILIYLAGVYCVGFAIFHGCFWRLFNWKNELRKISVANRAIMQIANLRLIYFFLFVAYFCFFYTHELATTPLGRSFLAGIALFWFGRLIEQFIFLRVRHRLVYLLTLLFALGTLLFAWPLFV